MIGPSHIRFERQKVFPLVYKGDVISAYIADLVVDNKVILELKSVKKLNELMQALVLHRMCSEIKICGETRNILTRKFILIIHL